MEYSSRVREAYIDHKLSARISRIEKIRERLDLQQIRQEQKKVDFKRLKEKLLERSRLVFFNCKAKESAHIFTNLKQIKQKEKRTCRIAERVAKHKQKLAKVQQRETKRLSLFKSKRGKQKIKRAEFIESQLLEQLASLKCSSEKLEGCYESISRQSDLDSSCGGRQNQNIDQREERKEQLANGTAELCPSVFEKLIKQIESAQTWKDLREQSVLLSLRDSAGQLLKIKITLRGKVIQLQILSGGLKLYQQLSRIKLKIREALELAGIKVGQLRIELKDRVEKCF